MKKVYWIICYEFFTGRNIRKRNSCFSEEQMEYHEFSNPLKHIIAMIESEDENEEKQDILILSISKVEMTQVEWGSR